VDVWQISCNAYYRIPFGRIFTQWPHAMDEFKRRAEREYPDAFEMQEKVPA